MPDQRDPVDRVVDLMVALPVSTAVAVGRAIPAAWSRVQRRALPVVDAFAHREGAAATVEFLDEPDLRSVPTRSDAEAGHEPEPTSAGISADELPIDGYDALAARQVVARLADLFPEELDAVERYEVAHRHRQTVLHRIAQLRT